MTHGVVSVIVNKDIKHQFPYSGSVSTLAVSLKALSRKTAGRDVGGSSVTVTIVGEFSYHCPFSPTLDQYFPP